MVMKSGSTEMLFMSPAGDRNSLSLDEHGVFTVCTINGVFCDQNKVGTKKHRLLGNGLLGNLQRRESTLVWLPFKWLAFEGFSCQISITVEFDCRFTLFLSIDVVTVISITWKNEMTVLIHFYWSFNIFGCIFIAIKETSSRASG